ncbi:MAG: DUF4912 domain-containing protein [Bacillota bacterium]|nr:DUF4912 domain-containing protein [Bacillota bacterium]
MYPPLPEDHNALVLLVQSPGVIHAYWTLSGEFWAAITARGEFALRLYELYDDRPGFLGFHEVRPGCRTGNWYFRQLDPNAVYRGELGRIEGGKFFPYLTSRPVETPPDGVVETPDGPPPPPDDAPLPAAEGPPPWSGSLPREGR